MVRIFKETLSNQWNKEKGYPFGQATSARGVGNVYKIVV
jgi:hypothetical protein